MSAASDRADAQERAQIAVVGGTATDQVGVRSNAVTVAPSIWFAPAEQASLSLGGSVTRFQNEAWSFGAGASLSARDAIAGPLSFAFDGSASLARLSAATSATFGSVELTPALQMDAGRFALFGGIRLATGMTSIETARPTLPGVGGSTRGAQRRSTGAAGPSFGASMLAVSSPDAAVRLSAREDRLHVSGAEIVDRTLAVTLATADVTLMGSAGRRRAPNDKSTFGGAALSLALRDDLALDISGGRYTSNPLTATSGGNYLNAGLSLRVGGAGNVAIPRPPRVPGAPAVPRGHTRLAISAPDAARVEIAGDFNEWKPVAATRASNGMWYVDLRIGPGQYRYAFRVNGTEWRVPRGATAVDDGYGGKSAWLVIAEDERRR